MRKLLILAFTVAFTCNINGQKIIQSIRYSAFADYFSTPSVVQEFQYSSLKYDHIIGTSYFTLMYDVKYNLLESDDKMALSFGITPTFGAYYSPVETNFGAGGYSIPGYLSINFGAGSTYESVSDFGIGFGAGFQTMRVALFGDTKYASWTLDKTYQLSWSQPILLLNIRWWGGGDKLNELTFRAGIPIKGKDDIGPIDMEEAKRGKVFQLSFGKFLNY